MAECRLLEENGRRHFICRRFDRPAGGGKLHMQTLGALAHFDFNQAGAYSYEQAMQIMRQLGLGMDAIEQQFRRMVFNIVGRNQDDHVKNIAFLMDRSGTWSLAPAYDVTYSYNPDGRWTSRHQMSLNGKRDDFTREDFDAVGRAVSLKRGRAREILDEVAATVARWPEFAAEAGVDAAHRASIQGVLRLGGSLA
jgi:serine/threonine-protein kinase HipA